MPQISQKSTLLQENCCCRIITTYSRRRLIQIRQMQKNCREKRTQQKLLQEPMQHLPEKLCRFIWCSSSSTSSSIRSLQAKNKFRCNTKKQNSSQIYSQTSPDFPDFPDFCSRPATDWQALDSPRRRSADRAREWSPQAHGRCAAAALHQHRVPRPSSSSSSSLPRSDVPLDTRALVPGPPCYYNPVSWTRLQTVRKQYNPLSTAREESTSWFRGCVATTPRSSPFFFVSLVLTTLNHPYSRPRVHPPHPCYYNPVS